MTIICLLYSAHLIDDFPETAKSILQDHKENANMYYMFFPDIFEHLLVLLKHYLGGIFFQSFSSKFSDFEFGSRPLRPAQERCVQINFMWKLIKNVSRRMMSAFLLSMYPWFVKHTQRRGENSSGFRWSPIWIPFWWTN